MEEISEEFEKWCEEVDADLPTRAFNAYCTYKCCKPDKNEYPAR